jgi:3-isopropylmalate/(R)-2-methylmalate dehydratase small subunit
LDSRAGKAWKYGDNIDTDVIIPARYLTATGMRELADHTLEDLDPQFASDVAQGDVIVAGSNFGCGSSREHAPVAIKGAGVGAVIACSFARIFFRNAINTGLPILVCPEAVDGIEAGDSVAVDPLSGLIENQSKGTSFHADPLPEFVMDIVTAGGLIPYVRARLEGVA